MRVFYNANAPKKATNLTVNADLLGMAKMLNINLSKTFEKALEQEIRDVERAHWVKENKGAIDVYNKHIIKHGLFQDDLGGS